MASTPSIYSLGDSLLSQIIELALPADSGLESGVSLCCAHGASIDAARRIALISRRFYPLVQPALWRIVCWTTPDNTQRSVTILRRHDKKRSLVRWLCVNLPANVTLHRSVMEVIEALPISRLHLCVLSASPEMTSQVDLSPTRSVHILSAPL